MQRAKKGTVAVAVDKGYLRLRWRYEGKQYALTTGLPDGQANRALAEIKARIIEADILTGNFDPSLKKYKPPRKLARYNVEREIVSELLDRYLKSKHLDPRTVKNHEGMFNHIYRTEGVGDKPVVFLGRSDAEKVLNQMKGKGLADRTIHNALVHFDAVWDWGKETGLAECNPWSEFARSFKVAPKQPARPFSRDEMTAILRCFRSDPVYRHYADFVEFLLGVGCRTGEAIGLRWRHVSDDCAQVWIGEAISRGREKATKTNKARYVDVHLGFRRCSWRGAQPPIRG